MGVLRMAWRNLWRHRRRTWLTTGAMIFSNVILVFMTSMQVGMYQMMIDNTLQAFSGHLQIQAEGYQDSPRMRTSVPDVIQLADEARRALPDASVAARASGFALASSEQRSFGIQVTGVQPGWEPLVSTIPGLVREGRFLDDPDAAEIVLGAVMARNLKVSVGDEVTLEAQRRPEYRRGLRHGRLMKTGRSARRTCRPVACRAGGRLSRRRRCSRRLDRRAK